MKKIFLIAFSLLIFADSNSQNLTVENQYLQIVNNQNDRFLIKDNIRNAELCADSLLTTDKENYLATDFFYNLAESYYLTRKYDYALFTMLRMKILFPNSDLQKKTNLLLNKTIKKYRKNVVIQKLFDKTNYDAIIKLNKNERILLLIELSFKLKSSRINTELWKLVEYYEIISTEKNPLWLEQWKLFNTLELNYKNQTKYIDFSQKDNNYSTIIDLLTNIEGKEKVKILNRAENYKIK